MHTITKVELKIITGLLLFIGILAFNSNCYFQGIGLVFMATGSYGITRSKFPIFNTE